MDQTPRPPSPSSTPPVATAPVTEADLHAYVDGQLPPARHEAIESFLAAHPEDRARVDDWQEHVGLLRGHLGSVMTEPLPLRLPLRAPDASWPWRAMAAGLVLAIGSAALAWTSRGAWDAREQREAIARLSAPEGPAGSLEGFAHRAAIAHAVYTPDARRPVEVSAEQEQALVTWLTKRIGSPVHAPTLGELGYRLIGGRLLPGGQGPVAQFMYEAIDKRRLTLYVTREGAITNGASAPAGDTAFRFGRDGPVNVFYWIEGPFGYAISAEAPREELVKVSREVYRQLKPG